MPYINQAQRERFVNALQDIKEEAIETPGNLNYLISTLCHSYLEEVGECYATYNEIIGVLECAKMELYRRKVAGYEDKAIEKNGDL